ncbi:MAG: hypothetical protein KF908_03250 [Nitrosomonas sp.]|nr:hypothetical protein [Nitrosomonas sp.]MCW5599935.1 hypothetical protein [Nitrosomonas sp.]MCW5608475.1 hypothetical protein [Nitrosomonas sp.]
METNTGMRENPKDCYNAEKKTSHATNTNGFCIIELLCTSDLSARFAIGVTHKSEPPHCYFPEITQTIQQPIQIS